MMSNNCRVVPKRTHPCSPRSSFSWQLPKQPSSPSKILTIQSNRQTQRSSYPTSKLSSRLPSQTRPDLIFCRLSLLKKPSTPLRLSPTDTLKLTFQIVEEDTKAGVRPHQTFLRFYDDVSGEEGIQPVRVTPGGKAKFELVCPVSLLMTHPSLIQPARRAWPGPRPRFHPHPTRR